jgi:hypothetical protein
VLATGSFAGLSRFGSCIMSNSTEIILLHSLNAGVLSARDIKGLCSHDKLLNVATSRNDFRIP